MQAKRFPPTPYHAELGDLKLTPRAADVKLTELQKLRLRKGSKVLWLSWQVRFDALFGAVLVSRCASNPCELYEACVDHIIFYLYGTRSIGLTLGGESSDQCLDAALRLPTSDTIDGSSDYGLLARTVCYTIERGPSTLAAVSRQDRKAATSTASGETDALCQLTASLIAMRALSTEIGSPMTRASIVGCDNDASVKIAFSAASVKRDLHTQHKTAFIQETQAEGEILPTKVRSEDNRSNILSKIIREPTTFKRERDLLLNVKNHVRPCD